MLNDKRSSGWEIKLMLPGYFEMDSTNCSQVEGEHKRSARLALGFLGIKTLVCENHVVGEVGASMYLERVLQSDEEREGDSL